MKQFLIFATLLLFTSNIVANEIRLTPAQVEVISQSEIPIAKSVNDNMSFYEAQAKAREEIGAGGLFKWRGNYFTTFTHDEWKALGADEQKQFNQTIDLLLRTGVKEFPIAQSVEDNMNFNQAMASARQEVGMGGMFRWRGNYFNTFSNDEWNALGPDEQLFYNNTASILAGEGIEKIPVARNINDEMTFQQAYNAARNEVGIGGIFEWRGNYFTTFSNIEWNSMAALEQNFYDNAIDELDANNASPVTPQALEKVYVDNRVETEQKIETADKAPKENIKVTEETKKTDRVTSDNQESSTLPTVLLIDSEFDENETTNDVSSLLQSSRDVFSNIAAYNFGTLRYRIRGYDSKYSEVLMDGILMNDPEGGRPYYSSWGGLNDMMRNSTTISNIGSTETGFGHVGGSNYISTRASNYRNQTSVSYANSNRSYNNRIMFSTATGMMENGWAFAVSGSKRWSQEGYVEGTWYNAYSYFMSAEKYLNDKHSLGFTIFGAPYSRAGSSPSVQEVYDLLDNNYYNPNWGYQTSAMTGEQQVRNARVSTYHQPVFLLSHYWTPSSKTKINTTAYYWFGRGGQTALDWNEANDPRPDYYRNLPSYLENDNLTEYAQALEDWTGNNTKVTQLDWDMFYNANRRHLQTVTNATFNGMTGQTIQGNFSKYILEERRTDKNQGGFNSSFEHEFSSRLHLNGGINARISRTHYFKVVNDLLGGDYYLDIDKYANQESLETTDESQNDLLNKNHVVEVGDIFGYNYIANINRANAWAQLRYRIGNFNLFGGAQATYTQFWRTGLFQNGRFANDSYGDSEKQNFLNGGIKAGGSYGINGRNYLIANVFYGSQAPQFRDAYIAPRVRNTLINNLRSENIFALDLSYQYASPNLKMRFTAYRTQLSNLVWNRSYYHEDERTYVNYIMSGINEMSQGFEFGAEYNISPTFTAQIAAAKGENVYTNRPNVSIYEDNDATPIAENRTVYLKNYNVGESPQTVASLGLKYNSPKYWWASFNANYFNDYYLSINPDKYTEESMSHFYEGDVRIDQVLSQTKLDPAFTLDFYAGKSWRVKGYYVLLNVSVNNLLNNKNIVMYGYEQLRVDYSDLDKFSDKYSYLYGRNYFISLTIRK